MEEFRPNEFDDEMNDETFGVDVSEIANNDFSFGQAPIPPTTTTAKILTVAELEAQLLPPSNNSKPSSYLTLEELERQFQASAVSEEQTVEDSTGNQVDEEHQELDNEFNGIMTDFEKEFIAKVQFGQVVNDESYMADFYNRRYKLKRTGVRLPDYSVILGGAAVGERNVPDRQPSQKGEQEETDQEQFSRILREVKANSRPKADKVAFEGALGKIAVSNLRNPKKLLDISRKSSTSSSLMSESPRSQMNAFSFRKILSSIERIYSHLIVIDDLYVQYQERNADNGSISSSQQFEWNKKYTGVIKACWAELHNIGRKVPVESSTELLETSPSEKSIALFLSISKGRKAMPRILKFLPKPQVMLLLKTTLSSLKNIIITSAEPVALLAELEEYSNHVVFPFVPIISECSMDIVIDCVGTLIKAGDIVSIARTKPGLLFLTLFISRAEIIKQQQKTAAKPEENVHKWIEDLFPSIFSSFQTRFVALFPPSHIMPPIVTSKSDNTIPQPIPVDDQYVWQFLASIAVGASLDQQRVLVSELRDKIFEVVTNGGKDGTRRVNLFLHALGLDASQLVS